jgi:nucleoredoxin
LLCYRCPPCRKFTPTLAEFYNKHHENKNLEIIFISSDRDEDSFNKYYGEMPWFTLDYKERKKKEELGKQFEITGIPTLILLDGDSGDIICKDARNEIQEKDPQAENFPWK